MADSRTVLGESGVPGVPVGEGWGWTRRQRWLAAIFSSAVIAFVIVGAIRMPANIGEALVTGDGAGATLPGRMDPNSASVAQLETVPHLSGKVARSIVLFREGRTGGAEGGAVFRGPEDLARVPGVTKAVLLQVGPYLEFPGDAADTQPMP